MAAAYAAVVSIQHIIRKIQLHHAPHIKFVGDNPRINALQERAIFLQDFLEAYYSKPGGHGGDETINAAQLHLESRIADAAHAVEDVLESHIVDQILAVKSSSSRGEESTSINHLDQRLEQLIKDIDLIIEKDVKNKKLEKKAAVDLDEQPTNITSVLLPGSSSTPPPSSTGNNAMLTRMVGFDEYLTQIMEELIGQEFNRRVIPISGMGGIGKTTLAKNVYSNSLIMQYFDRRAWAAVSQNYSIREILSALLNEITGLPINYKDHGPEDKLGEMLHKELWGRRYLIILDDMWSIEAWDKVKFYFPDSQNGSRIMITTRLSSLASHFNSSGLKIDFLEDDRSWDLFCQKVFGDKGYCPDLELEKLGKMIATRCNGLPLSIVTIAGLLAKSQRAPEYWEYVLENLNSKVALDDNEHCFKVLFLSYSHLPIHLKPCFLYMGFLPENSKIQDSTIIKLWVAEGFLKPNKDKSFEEIGNDCLKDLIDRNLILVNETWGPNRTRKTCYVHVHDLLRDLCLREAQREKFLVLANKTNQNLENQRRLVIQERTVKSTDCEASHHALEFATLARSFITYDEEICPFPTYRLLRVLRIKNTCSGCEVFEFVNSRYLEFDVASSLKLPPSISLLWNLEALIIYEAPEDDPIYVPVEIWEMQQLKHLIILEAAILHDPPSTGQINGNDNNSLVLWNLQMITFVVNFKLTEEVIRRIPNVKTLEIECFSNLEWLRDQKEEISSTDRCVVKNLYRLIKLESLYLSLMECPHSPANNWQEQLNFPNSLKRLRLQGGELPWESMTKIGSLPSLEQLILWPKAFSGGQWNPIDGEFLNLKLLKIDDCSLKKWNAYETSFPHLEILAIEDMSYLEDIPLDIGHIPTLQSIFLKNCSEGVFNSATEIQRQQQSLGNESLQVHISEDETEEESDDESEDTSDDESEDESEDE